MSQAQVQVPPGLEASAGFTLATVAAPFWGSAESNHHLGVVIFEKPSPLKSSLVLLLGKI